jgi:glycosyltransferase involved in cell wall biosynthesis
MKVLQVTGAYPPATAYTGPPASLHRLCQEMIRQGASVRVATTDADRSRRSGITVNRWSEYEAVPVFYGRRFGPRGAFSPAFLRTVMSAAAEANLVHATAVYGWTLLAAAAAARRRGIPLVLSPRGSFAPEALAWHPWRKRAFGLAGGNAALRSVDAFHATTVEEEGHVLRLFPAAHVGRVPNGVDIPSDEALARLRGPGREEVVLFLGRLHSHKNPELLLRAFAAVARAHAALVLLLVGPDDEGIGGRLERLAADLGLAKRVRLLGRRDGEEKAALLARARVLVLPSKSENFGNVVAEALAHGTPVVTTTGTPWSEAAERGAGFWVEPTEAALAAALREAAALPPERLDAMGARGRAWMQETFSWPAVAARMRAFHTVVIARHAAARGRASAC